MQQTADQIINEVANYTQLCVWPATVLPPDQIKDFEHWMHVDLMSRVKYVSQEKTKPDLDEAGNPVPDTGNRTDLFFYVHKDDIIHFAILRLMYGMRWWEDHLTNGNGRLYSEEFLNDHPKTW